MHIGKRRTDKTLVEQMQIGDIEILRRLELLGLDRKALDVLPNYKAIIDDCIDQIIDDFYKSQTEIEEIAMLIGDADTLSRLRSAQRKYVTDLFSGHYDSEYVNNRLRIGLVHKRIGVEPKLYLSAVVTLKGMLFGALREAVSAKDDCAEVIDILDKLMYFDVTLVFDTYIDSLLREISSAKKKTEIYAKSLENKVAERTRQLEEQASLDPLTNIYNTRAMQDMLRKELAIAKRRHTNLSLVYFDVDHFKQINDKEGHIKGDEVLKSIGKMLRNTVRETDIPCRYGGDEFCLVLLECSALEAKAICEKFIKAFSVKYPDYSLSIGIADTGESEHNMDTERLIQLADKKMYIAKKGEGHQIVV